MSSSEIAISAERLGKRYLLPHREISNSRQARFRSHLKEFFPFLGRIDDMDYFWALRDVSFEVRKGEILGILGSNGSGKSTLLKMLSRVTQPTIGRAILRGRVGSLLEVGTGFHPDLTGRENVYMAGALLGLKQKEVRAQFDNIVEFSGVDRFIDVPVKRYSSGMYVRLAYSVASMLHSDILILDEVLAVGDAAFLEKSQQNIEKLAHDGRTVLFVTHNVRAMATICNTGMILDAGQCVFHGTARETVATYMRRVHLYDVDERTDVKRSGRSFHDIATAPRLIGEKSVLLWVSTHTSSGELSNTFRTGQPIVVRVGYRGAEVSSPYFSVIFQNDFAEIVATVASSHGDEIGPFCADGVIECRINDLRLGEGTYRIMVDFGSFGGTRSTTTSLDCVPNAAQIRVELGGYLGGNGLDAYEGAVHKSIWRYIAADDARVKGMTTIGDGAQRKHLGR